MTQGDKLRKENKHRKIVLKRSGTLGGGYTVVRAVNTIDAQPMERMEMVRIKHFIDRGFTVEMIR